MMNGLGEHHDDQPAGSTEVQESVMPLASQTGVLHGTFPSTPESSLPCAESDSSVPHVECCSATQSGMESYSAPESSLLLTTPSLVSESLLLAKPILGPRTDLVPADVWDVCSALLVAVELRAQIDKPPLPAVQIVKTPSEAEASSLPDAVVSPIPPDLPVPDFQSCSGVEADDCSALPDSVVSVIEYVVGSADEREETLPLSEGSLPVTQDTLQASEHASAVTELELLPNQALPMTLEAPPSPEVLRSAESSMNCSRFGRMRKRPRLSPPDTPVKKPKVVFKVTEMGPFPAPVKKKVVFNIPELGLLPSTAKKLSVKKKSTKSKAEPTPVKKLKSAKPENAVPTKKLKSNPKAASGLPTPVKTTKVKSKPAAVSDKKSKGGKPQAELNLAALTCRHIKNKWNPGDVVWFKVSKEPYWPGKVTHDSATGEFKRVKGSMNEYCLLPFGQDASCRWVLAPMMLKFHGRQQFEEHRQTLLDKHPEDSPTRLVIETKFSVTNFKLEEWIKVVQEAENGYLNGRIEAIKVEVGGKNTNETKTALPAKNGVKKPLLGDSLLVPPKRSQKRKNPALPCKPKKQRQNKGKIEVDQQVEGDVATKKKHAVKTKAAGALPDVIPKKSKKKKKSVEVTEKLVEPLELNDTTSSVESTIQDVINFSAQCSQVQSTETVAVEVDAVVKPKKKRSANRKKKTIPVKEDSKKPPNPDDSRGKRALIKSPDRQRPSKKTVKTSPLKRFLNDLSQHSGDSDSGGSAKKESVPVEGKYEKVCQACEQIIPSSDGVRCIGNCNSIFHVACTKVTDPPAKEGSYKCEECTTGIHTCFACKKNTNGEIKRCSIRLCGKFYHPACLDLYRTSRMDGDHITCSLHSCMSCALNLNATNGKKGRLVRCLRCPVAYHFAEDCLAAGSLIVSHSSIICPKHYEPKKLAKMMHVNVNWCFVCSSGGSLICCESCPASFHAECLGIVPPEGSYYCAECLAGTQPKYGIIVWVKLGNYRWWPAKIINPRNAPSNIRNMPHQVGEFPVCFFGTHDYFWTTRSRVFQFLEGDQGAHDNAANRLAKRYEKALNEACVAYHEWKIAKECRAAQDYEKNSLIPPRYKPIKVNRPVGRVSMTTADPSQMTPCDCDPSSVNPCGSDSECLNRMLMFECHPAVCAAGEKCQNQRFEKRQYKPAEIFKAEGKGWGLKSLVDIRKGEFVNEYIGEIIDENECRLRMKRMHEENNTNYYFLTIDKDRIIDAARKGNLSRFMNHSCQPNCETHKWTVNGNTRVGLFAVCDIPKGTELTFNYNLDCLGNNKTTCRCEAPNCSGFIGERPKRAMQNKPCQKDSDKAAGMKKKKRKKAAAKCEHEDDCFRCGHDGELLMCDRKNCPKSYHLSCLDLEKPPHGRWECPWHHCDICGKVSTALCFVCPNSYCKEHAGENIKNHEDGNTYCGDHVTEEEALNRSSNVAQSEFVKAEDALVAVPGAPKVKPTIINLKKKCERVKTLPIEEPDLVHDKKRQRMIAEKLKIKLNGSKKHSFPTCKRIRVAPKKRKTKAVKKQRAKGTAVPQVPNGLLKHHEAVNSVNGNAILLNGIKKSRLVKTALGGNSTKKKKKRSVPKTILLNKVNGKTIKISSKKKGSKGADRSEDISERTETVASPATCDAIDLPEICELALQPV